jgi:hypothetical protein
VSVHFSALENELTPIFRAFRSNSACVGSGALGIGAGMEAWVAWE